MVGAPDGSIMLPEGCCQVAFRNFDRHQRSGQAALLIFPRRDDLLLCPGEHPVPPEDTNASRFIEAGRA